MKEPVSITSGALEAELNIPFPPRGVVVFVRVTEHDHVDQHRALAERLSNAGFATLSFDLLTPAEQRAGAPFDVDHLGRRIAEAVDWVAADARLRWQPVGLFATGAAAAAALAAAVRRPARVCAVVSCSGRPDLAARYLGEVTVPSLFLVGGGDAAATALHHRAAERMEALVDVVVVGGVNDVLDEYRASGEVTSHTLSWFDRWLRRPSLHPASLN